MLLERSAAPSARRRFNFNQCTRATALLNNFRRIIVGSTEAIFCLDPAWYMIYTVRNSSRGKVMFSQACVKNSVHGGVHGRGACMACEHAWQAGMHGRGCVWQGGHAWQERRPLQPTVRIYWNAFLFKMCWN